MSGSPRRPPIFGAEPWTTLAGGEWCHFDWWFALITVTDFDGDVDALERELVARLRSPLHGRDDVEAKLSHLNLRPSGYELCSRRVPRSTGEQGIRGPVLLSAPFLSRPVPRDTAEITAELAMQNGMPPSVTALGGGLSAPLPRSPSDSGTPTICATVCTSHCTRLTPRHPAGIETLQPWARRAAPGNDPTPHRRHLGFRDEVPVPTCSRPAVGSSDPRVRGIPT